MTRASCPAGDEIFDNYTLLAVNAVILAVMAGAFAMAGRDRPEEAYWSSWGVGNILLASALVIYMLEARLPAMAAALLPNGLLVLGFGLRWLAARQFAGRPATGPSVWGPALLFCIVATPAALAGAHWAVFTAANILLTMLATLTAIEFWRGSGERLPSRHALAAAYVLIALSFGVRVGQGLFAGEAMQQFLPLDMMLTVHLMVAVVHCAMSGAFALSLGFERKASHLRHAAMHDALTGLLNRGAFESMLRAEFERPQEPQFAVAVFDIDHFKSINDSHGHAAGDAVIRAGAEALALSAGPDDLVARIGGEEFAVLMRDCDRRRAGETTELMRRAIGSLRVEADGAVIRPTASAGYCHAEDCPPDFDAMMRVVDNGLYRAKRSGRDQVAAA